MRKHRKLTRSRKDKIILGICGGLAEYMGKSSGLLRIVLIALTLLGVPYLIFIYLICYFLIPLEERDSNNSNSTINRHTTLNDEDTLNKEFKALDESLNLLEKKLASLEDLTVKRSTA